MKALGNEIVKNLVLAGVGSLTILDHELVTEDDLCSQFLVSEEDLGKNRAEAALPQAQKLNPRVQLFVDTAPVVSKRPEYFSSFDVTIVTGQHIDIASNINTSCRLYGRKFYSADTHGMYGYIFADLVSHQFVIEREKGNITTKVGRDPKSTTASVISVTEKRDNNKVIEVVMKSEEYSLFLLANSSPLPAAIAKNRRSRMKVRPLLSCLRALFDFERLSGGRLPGHNRADLELFTKLANEKHLELELPMETLSSNFLRSFLQNLGSELSPVVAYLGGNLAQDVINVLGQREQPLQNLLLFDGEEFLGPVYSMHPMNDENLMAATQSGMMNGIGYADASMNGHTNGTAMA
jgi:ubiquitin-like 1-activating enzyme E1 A